MKSFFETFEKTKSRWGISSSSHSGIEFHSFLRKKSAKLNLMIINPIVRKYVKPKTFGSENQLKKELCKHFCKPKEHMYSLL